MPLTHLLRASKTDVLRVAGGDKVGGHCLVAREPAGLPVVCFPYLDLVDFAGTGAAASGTRLLR